MINVQIDVNGNFTIGDYNYTQGCSRHDEYLDIKSHYDAGNSDKYNFLPYVLPATPKKTTQQKIAVIESQYKLLRTDRLKREAKLGLTYDESTGQTSADRLNELYQEEQDKISELRKQL